jgi:hypothetical protein
MLRILPTPLRGAVTALMLGASTLVITLLITLLMLPLSQLIAPVPP